jgi:hypothetical protein
MAGTAKSKFAFDYIAPKTRDCRKPKKDIVSDLNRTKLRCFTDLHTKLYDRNPGPAGPPLPSKPYNMITDWTKTL